MIEKLVYQYYLMEERPDMPDFAEPYGRIIRALKNHPGQKLYPLTKELSHESLALLMKIINDNEFENISLNNPKIDPELKQFLKFIREFQDE